jgi:hypothetical protein
MISINKEYSLNQLRELIRQNFYKTKQGDVDLDSEQKKILEIFNKRIFLEETIDETTSFNRKLDWDTSQTGYSLTTTAEELVEVFKLRSEIYEQMNYGNEFPDIIEGLNFDRYDIHSAIIYCKKDKEYTGTSRIIFDDKRNKLQTDEKFSFDYLREKKKKIAETSRFTIKKDDGKLSLDFKNIMKAYHDVMTQNNMDLIVSSIAQRHYKLYSKFGGIKIEKELHSFGHLQGDFLVISWDPYQVSPFFKRSFLR